LGLVLFVPGCIAAAWWQITRATDGNGLSYLYAVEWPLFAILGIYFWWMFIHTDYDRAGLRGMRRRAASATESDDTPSPSAPVVASQPASDEDPELAAYNARLAELSSQGAKTWRHREVVVVRRPQ